jgi:hypothetical protein
MNRIFTPVCMLLLMLSACNDDGETPPTDMDTARASTSVPVAPVKPGRDEAISALHGAPVIVHYRVIGAPVVGQPVVIDLRFESALGVQPLDISYRTNDTTALQMAESQLLSTTVSPIPGEESAAFAAQQVTVIPMREGRLYLNVAAQIETDTGSWSSVTAVPIEVGVGPRELQDNGVVTTDENGNLIRTLPAKED